MRRVRRADRTLRLEQNNFVANINTVKAFVLCVIKVSPHGILNGVDDGGIAFAGEHSPGDFIFGRGKPLLTLQPIKADGAVGFFRLTFFPNLYALGEDDFFIRGSGGGGVGGCGGRGGGEAGGGVGFLCPSKGREQGQQEQQWKGWFHKDSLRRR